jgi:hypothetical protein
VELLNLVRNKIKSAGPRRVKACTIARRAEARPGSARAGAGCAARRGRGGRGGAGGARARGPRGAPLEAHEREAVLHVALHLLDLAVALHLIRQLNGRGARASVSE